MLRIWSPRPYLNLFCRNILRLESKKRTWCVLLPGKRKHWTVEIGIFIREANVSEFNRKIFAVRDRARIPLIRFNFRLEFKKGFDFFRVHGNTFVKLLLRLYDVAEGEIYINGKSIREYDIHALRMEDKNSVRISDGRQAMRNNNGSSFVCRAQNCLAHLILCNWVEGGNISLYGEVSEPALHEVTKMLGLDSVLAKNHTNYQAEYKRGFSSSVFANNCDFFARTNGKIQPG